MRRTIALAVWAIGCSDSGGATMQGPPAAMAPQPSSGDGVQPPPAQLEAEVPPVEIPPAVPPQEPPPANASAEPMATMLPQVEAPPPEPAVPEVPFVDVTSVSYTNGCGNKTTDEGSTAEVEAGRSYDLTGYGLEMGFHCDIDHGHFAYVEITGDFDFVAQVAEAGTDDGAHHSRAGLMARALPAGPGDMFVGVTVSSNYSANHFADLRNWAVRMQPRAKLEGPFYYHVAQENIQELTSSHQKLPFPREFPNEWLRLQRKGDTYMAWYGSDGESWKEHRRWNEAFPQGPGTSWTVDLGDTVAVGLTVEGSPEHSHTMRATAKFRNIRITVPE